MKVNIKNIVDFYKLYPEHIGKINVNTRFGYKKIEYADKSAQNSDVYEIIVDGVSTKGSPDHLFFDNIDWKKLKNFSVGDKILTKNGIKRIQSIEKLSYKQDLYDLQVEDVKEFFANDLVSHNSTLLEAITYGLFGKPFRKINIGNLVNDINKKNLLVELWFSVGKDKYRIERGIKPNIFVIEKNGEALPELASNSDIQTFIDKNIVYTNIDAFKQVIILGTAGFTPFMELAPAKRRTLVEELLNVTIFGYMNKLNKTQNDTIKSQMDALEIKVRGVSDEITAHETHIERAKRQTDVLVDDLNKQIEDTKEDGKTIKAEIDKIDLEISELQDKFIEDYQNDIQSAIRKLTIIGQKIDEVKRSEEFFKQSDCPTCGQSISEEHAKKHISVCHEKLKLIESKRIEISKEELDFKSKQCIVNENKEKIQAMKIKSNELKSDLRGKAVFINQLKEQIDKISENSEIDTTRLETLKVDLFEFRKQKNTLFSERYCRNIAHEMLKDTGIRSAMVNRYLPVINKNINRYLKEMGADYKFLLDKEFNESIKTKGKESFKYESFSQGEKARIDLSILLTWRYISSKISGININLMILDEVFDSATDEEGIKAINNILNGLDSNVIIISHRESHDKESFDQHIQMVKKGRYSIINT